MAERARPPLEAAAVPAAHPPRGQVVDDAREERLVVVELLVGQPVGAQEITDLGLRVLAAEVGVTECGDARLAEQVMVGPQRRPDRAPVVARRGRDVDALEARVAQDLGVGHGVQRHAARQAEVAQAGATLHRAGERDEHLLGHRLDRRRDVAVERVERLVAERRVARLAAHHLRELRRDRGVRGVLEREVVEVEPVGSVRADADHLLDAVDVPGLAVGRHAHQLVLALVHLEAAVRGERRVEQPERVREAALLLDVDPRAAADADRPGRPLARAVHGDDRGLVVGRAEEARRGVRHVVLAEQDLARGDAQPLADQRLDPQLVGDPATHRLAEHAGRTRKGRERREQQPLELHERLLVEHHPGDVVNGDAGASEHEVDGERGEAVVVLDTREALLLAGGDDHAVVDQGGRAVVVVEGEPENVHDHLTPRGHASRAAPCRRTAACSPRPGAAASRRSGRRPDTDRRVAACDRGPGENRRWERPIRGIT